MSTSEGLSRHIYLWFFLLYFYYFCAQKANLIEIINTLGPLLIHKVQTRNRKNTALQCYARSNHRWFICTDVCWIPSLEKKTCPKREIEWKLDFLGNIEQNDPWGKPYGIQSYKLSNDHMIFFLRIWLRNSNANPLNPRDSQSSRFELNKGQRLYKYTISRFWN
jgi:hypothetical protein